MSVKNRTKRPKFYHVPNDTNRPTKIRHTAYTTSSGKITTRNSFVNVTSCPSAASDSLASTLTVLDPYTAEPDDLCSLDDIAPHLEHPNWQQHHLVCFHPVILILIQYS